uniref:Uncharacterized protein n=1 Tax=Glossina pallidipes TaxID=7398 RepID=A0A1B0A4N3_GLOPL
MENFNKSIVLLAKKTDLCLANFVHIGATRDIRVETSDLKAAIDRTPSLARCSSHVRNPNFSLSASTLLPVLRSVKDEYALSEYSVWFRETLHRDHVDLEQSFKFLSSPDHVAFPLADNYLRSFKNVREDYAACQVWDTVQAFSSTVGDNSQMDGSLDSSRSPVDNDMFENNYTLKFVKNRSAPILNWRLFLQSRIMWKQNLNGIHKALSVLQQVLKDCNKLDLQICFSSAQDTSL